MDYLEFLAQIKLVSARLYEMVTEILTVLTVTLFRTECLSRVRTHLLTDLSKTGLSLALPVSLYRLKYYKMSKKYKEIIISVK